MGDYELSVQFPCGDHEGTDLEHDPSETVLSEDDKELFHDRARNLEL
ncbi:MAG: hypothetical protein ABEH65_07150 [Halobacteriales archaeon]